MSFYQRYELARLVREGEVKSFSGTQIETGLPVLLHMLDGKVAAELRPVIERLRITSGRADILETGDFAGSYYVVTTFIQPFEGLSAWLAKLGDSPALPDLPPPPIERPQQTKPPSKPVPPAPQAGDFTRMFDKPAEAPRQPPSPPPGDFTKMFDLDAEPIDNSGIGEFAKVFDAPPKPEPQPKPKASDQWEAWPEFALKPKSPSDGPGDFTRFFGSSISGEDVNVEAEQAHHAQLNEPSDARPFQKASDFTRMFGPATGDIKPIVPPQLPANPDQPVASRLFNSGIMRPTRPSAEPTKSAPSSTEPGEYTRMIRTPAVEKQPVPPPPIVQAAPPPPPAPPSTPIWKIILLILAGILGLSAFALLIYFVQSRLAVH